MANTILSKLFSKNTVYFCVVEVFVGWIIWQIFHIVYNIMYPNVVAGDIIYVAIGIITYYISELVFKVIEWAKEIRYETRTEFAGYNQR